MTNNITCSTKICTYQSWQKERVLLKCIDTLPIKSKKRCCVPHYKDLCSRGDAGCHHHYCSNFFNFNHHTSTPLSHTVTNMFKMWVRSTLVNSTYALYQPLHGNTQRGQPRTNYIHYRKGHFCSRSPDTLPIGM